MRKGEFGVEPSRFSTCSTALGLRTARRESISDPSVRGTHAGRNRDHTRGLCPGLHSVAPSTALRAGSSGLDSRGRLSPREQKPPFLQGLFASPLPLTSTIPRSHASLLARHFKQKNAGGDGHINRVATAAHGNADHKIRRFDEMAGEATLFASDEEHGWPTAAQGFVVQQAAWRRTDDRHSGGLCPIGKFAGGALHQLLRKQRSHAGANRGGVSS